MRKLRTFKRGTVTIVAIDDPLMEETAQSLRETTASLLETGDLRLVVDLGSVPFIDSPGLETLLDLKTMADDRGGVFCLTSANELCRDILTATRLDQVILTYPTVEEACRSFM